MLSTAKFIPLIIVLLIICTDISAELTSAELHRRWSKPVARREDMESTFVNGYKIFYQITASPHILQRSGVADVVGNQHRVLYGHEHSRSELKLAPPDSIYMFAGNSANVDENDYDPRDAE